VYKSLKDIDCGFITFISFYILFFSMAYLGLFTYPAMQRSTLEIQHNKNCLI